MRTITTYRLVAVRGVLKMQKYKYKWQKPIKNKETA